MKGHPGLIVEKSDSKNKYKAVVTGTTKGRHMTPLSHSTESRTEMSYVRNKPVEGKRKHFGSKELKGMKPHRDDRTLIRVISKRKPTNLKK